MMTKEQKTGRFLSITTLVAVLSLSGGMLAWANAMVERVVTVEQRMQYKDEALQRIVVDHDDDIQALMDRFDRLEDVLNTLKDREGLIANRLEVVLNRLENLDMRQTGQ